MFVIQSSKFPIVIEHTFQLVVTFNEARVGGKDLRASDH